MEKKIKQKISSRSSFQEILREISIENTTHMAAALSYTTLLALVPLATVALSMFSLFPVFSEFEVQLQDFIYTNLVPTAGDAIRQSVNSFIQKAGRLTTIGLVILLITSLMMLSTIEDSLNRIWHVPKGRSISHRILVYWAMISLGPLLIGAGLSLTSYLAASKAMEVLVIGGSSKLLFNLLPVVLETSAFVLSYMLVPNCKVDFRHAAIGGVIASLMFQFAKSGFAYYISNFKTYEVIYGALATLPIFLVWVFVSWCVFLLGAQIAAALGRAKTHRDPVPLDE